MIKKAIFVLFPIFLGTSGFLFGQTFKSAERNMLMAFDKLEAYKNSNMAKGSYVSINDNIRYRLSEYLKVTSFPPSLVKQLKQKKVEIAKSLDNLVTIISWGSWENRVLQSYSSMIQYKNGNHFVVKLLFNAIDSGDSGPRYLQVIISAAIHSDFFLRKYP